MGCLFVLVVLFFTKSDGGGFPFNTSLRRHHQSQRHVEYLRRNEERQLRVRNAELERELAKARHDLETLREYLRNPARRAVTPRMKKEVAARAAWRCAACGGVVNANYEVDHVVPLYLAGSNSLENLQVLCPDCHRTKTAADRRGQA